MIEAAMIWNEPNNLSHWDFELDRDWAQFAELVRQAGAAIAAERPGLPRVLGGISPIDPGFIQTLQRHEALDAVDAGPLKNARLLEPLGYFNIQLGYGMKMGTDTGFRLMHK